MKWVTFCIVVVHGIGGLNTYVNAYWDSEALHCDRPFQRIREFTMPVGNSNEGSLSAHLGLATVV